MDKEKLAEYTVQCNKTREEGVVKKFERCPVGKCFLAWADDLYKEGDDMPENYTYEYLQVNLAHTQQMLVIRKTQQLDLF